MSETIFLSSKEKTILSKMRKESIVVGKKSFVDNESVKDIQMISDLNVKSFYTLINRLQKKKKIIKVIGGFNLT